MPVIDEIIDHGRIGQRRGVAEVAILVFGNLAQDSSHDLARAGFRQAWCELDQIGRGDRPDLLAHPADQFLAEVFARVFARHQGDIGVDTLAFDVVRVADDGCFRHFRMSNERAFHLGGAEAMARYVNDIVDAAGDPVITVLVAPASVTRKILAGIGFEVGVDEALMVAIDRAHLTGPRVR